MCGRVAPASNGGVRSHGQQVARRLAALEDCGERWRCAVALAGIVVQRERLARARAALVTRPECPDSTSEEGPTSNLLQLARGGRGGRGGTVICPPAEGGK